VAVAAVDMGAAALVVAVASTEEAWAALAAADSTVALSLEDFTALAPAPSFEDPTMAASMALAPVPSFEDLMATTTGTTTTATGRMGTGTTTLTTIRTTPTTILTTTTAVATFFGDGCTPRMAGVCNPARYAVDRPSLIDVDRGLKRQLTAYASIAMRRPQRGPALRSIFAGGSYFLAATRYVSAITSCARHAQVQHWSFHVRLPGASVQPPRVAEHSSVMSMVLVPSYIWKMRRLACVHGR
jgi:hypothetical protein